MAKDGKSEGETEVPAGQVPVAGKKKRARKPVSPELRESVLVRLEQLKKAIEDLTLIGKIASERAAAQHAQEAAAAARAASRPVLRVIEGGAASDGSEED